VAKFSNPGYLVQGFDERYNFCEVGMGKLQACCVEYLKFFVSTKADIDI